MRSFDMPAAAFALDVPPKWLDNLLSRHDVPGIARGRQGTRRRLQPDAILRIAIAVRLIEDLGLPAHRALAASDRLIRDGRISGADGLELHLDIAALSGRLEARLSDAAECALPRRRGRPPRSARRGAIPESPARS